MNEKENEPPTSFKAGEPAHGDGSIQAGAPINAGVPITGDDSIESGAVSILDHWAEGIKNYERWGLAGGIALQLAVLFSMIVMGGFKALAGGF